jgi:hypothetical protein
MATKVAWCADTAASEMYAAKPYSVAATDLRK